MYLNVHLVFHQNYKLEWKFYIHYISESVCFSLFSCLETVFSSQACINCSFLLPNDEHYCCMSRRHGVDLPLAEQCFSAIGRVENSSIKELVSTESFFL